MTNKRVLFVSQAIEPFVVDNRISALTRQLPQAILESGKEIRTFMPRWGNINERRYQLHEVIRLSGINLIINESDHPLVIKVASIQQARMQIYFIDNEEYFQRKNTFRDDAGKFYPDNDERMIFFCRGVVEAIRKLGWAPHIVHCHGWISSLVPVYIRMAFKDDPNFEETKVILSLYNDGFRETLSKNFQDKVIMDDMKKKNIPLLENASYNNLLKTAIRMSDGIVISENEVNPELKEYSQELKKPLLIHPEKEDFADVYNDFYESILEETVLTD